MCWACSGSRVRCTKPEPIARDTRATTEKIDSVHAIDDSCTALPCSGSRVGCFFDLQAALLSLQGISA